MRALAARWSGHGFVRGPGPRHGALARRPGAERCPACRAVGKSRVALRQDSPGSTFPRTILAKMSGTPIAGDERGILEVLDSLVGQSEVRQELDRVGSRLEEKLEADRSSLLVWEPVDLSLYGGPVPDGIRSSWVFVLRAKTGSGAERHPNSIQRVMSLRGSADLQTQVGERPGENWTSNRLVSRPTAALEDRWLSIPRGVWHQGVMGGENWVVVSFHTALAQDLIEERPASQRGETLQRTYIPKGHS